MRIIHSDEIKKAVEQLFVDANFVLPESLKDRLHSCFECEKNPLAKGILSKLEDNLDAAKNINVPICQDTGMAVLFAEIGNQVYIEGQPFEEAVNDAVSSAYINGYMRKSVVKDPLYERTNTNDNTPAVIHTKIVKGDKIKLTACPKGFGSENMSSIKMFTPSATEDDIIDFVVDTVKNAGANPCPPVVVGVGIGGTFEYCALLSKLALSRDVDARNPDERYARLEKLMLDKINELDIGPQGYGGDTTALSVNIEKYPTHIAGLPVAVNIGCHVTRHKTCII